MTTILLEALDPVRQKESVVPNQQRLAVLNRFGYSPDLEEWLTLICENAGVECNGFICLSILVSMGGLLVRVAWRIDCCYHGLRIILCPILPAIQGT